ncbi:MAG: hypothetical protein R8M14_05055 [Ghiorsea sp.]
MIIRLLMIAALVFFAIKLFRFWVTEKKCDTCGKRIAKEADVCSHCNTIQQKIDG